jgi:hypothetical protein
MSALNYLNIPKLDIPVGFACTNVYYRSKDSSGYVSYVMDDPGVLGQLHSIFPDFLLSTLEGIFLQEINPGFNQKVHIDPRTIAINYILDTGGGTETYFINPPETHRIIPHSWHWFYANKPHAVRNVTSMRRSITLTIKYQPIPEVLNWLVNNG